MAPWFPIRTGFVAFSVTFILISFRPPRVILLLVVSCGRMFPLSCLLIRVPTVRVFSLRVNASPHSKVWLVARSPGVMGSLWNFTCVSGLFLVLILSVF